MDTQIGNQENKDVEMKDRDEVNRQFFKNFKENVKMKKNTNPDKKSSFNFDEFRTDINNNVKFAELKSKYGIRTRTELDSYLYKLSKMDKKIYEYTHEVIRGLPVYESQDGFVKISPREINKIKSTLGCKKLTFGELAFDGSGKIIIEVKAA